VDDVACYAANVDRLTTRAWCRRALDDGWPEAKALEPESQRWAGDAGSRDQH
jgi:hypothetical protein